MLEKPLPKPICPFMETAICLHCSEPLVGRSDKKFCDDHCRNTYHYENNRELSNFTRKVNLRLRKNRNILARLNKHEKTKVHREQMLEEGFKFSYLTNTFTSRRGSTYFFCYDQGYMELGNDFFMLVVKKKYVD